MSHLMPVEKKQPLVSEKATLSDHKRFHALAIVQNHIHAVNHSVMKTSNRESQITKRNFRVDPPLDGTDNDVCCKAPTAQKKGIRKSDIVSVEGYPGPKTPMSGVMCRFSPAILYRS